MKRRRRLVVRRSPRYAEGAVADPDPPALVDAVQFYGATALARLIGADPEEVRRWYRHHKPIPPEYVRRVEEVVS